MLDLHGVFKIGLAALAPFVLLAPLLGLFAFVGCGDGRTPLVLYSPHGRDLLTLVEDEFEALHPDVDVRWLDMGSQEVYDRVRSEAANPQADVWFGGPDTIFSRGAQEGLLEPFAPSWTAGQPPELRRGGDHYASLYLAVPLLMYNSDAVSAADAPSDWDDLLDPRWSDRIVIRDPLASGTMRTVFGMVLSQSVMSTGDPAEGFEWLSRLDAQTREYVVNPALLFEKITRQEGLVSIWELTDMLFLQQRGAPVGYAFADSGTPVIADSIGLVAGARHPDPARKFIEWIGSPEALALTAERAFRLPARSDLGADALPTWARDALAEIRPADVDWDLIASEGNNWMAEWDRSVRGQGRAVEPAP